VFSSVKESKEAKNGIQMIVSPWHRVSGKMLLHWISSSVLVSAGTADFDGEDTQ